MSDHRGARVGNVGRRLVVTAVAGVLVTLVCWVGLMLAVPRQGPGELPVFMLNQQVSGVVR